MWQDAAAGRGKPLPYKGFRRVGTMSRIGASVAGRVSGKESGRNVVAPAEEIEFVN
jgi:hypothetical protein